MIHISLKGKAPPEEWLKKAANLTDELLKVKPSERNDFIEKTAEYGETKRCWNG